MEAINFFHRHPTQRIAARNEFDLVFADDSQPIRRSSRRKGSFWTALKRAGLPYVRSLAQAFIRGQPDLAWRARDGTKPFAWPFES